jgi:hypothetical protein
MAIVVKRRQLRRKGNMCRAAAVPRFHDYRHLPVSPCAPAARCMRTAGARAAPARILWNPAARYLLAAALSAFWRAWFAAPTIADTAKIPASTVTQPATSHQKLLPLRLMAVGGFICFWISS